MTKHTYRSMDEAPRDGMPIIAVVGGVEAAIMWADMPVLGASWYFFDEDDDAVDGNTAIKVKQAPSGWRRMF